MSIKKLFDAKKSGKLAGSSKSTLKQLGDNVESPGQIKAALEKSKAFVPKIDFSDPANFVKYGSAYRYYYDTFTYIKDYYPYDGSSKEKLEFYNSLSPFEQHIIDNEYPRTTGYVTIGAIYGTDDSPTAGYTTPTVAEHIQFKGGPHTGTFFATGSGLSNNLEFGGPSGSTVEFFYNKNGFDSSVSSPTEVILDIWNGASSAAHDYGRLTIETHSGSADRFYVTYQSGTNGNTNGVFKAEIPSAGGLALGSGSWNHYAIVFSSGSTNTSISLYENGTCKESGLLTGSSIGLVTGSLIGRIGALRTAPSGSGYAGVAAGDGKLSASLDEFRFWKEPRTSEEIGRNWYMAVNGGANTTINNAGLGVYFKFNEGITNVAETDKVVLDYSSRLSNGDWTGYSTSGTRNTGSAIMSSSAATFEETDPVIYGNHPSYLSSRDDLSDLGKAYDYTNNSSLYYSMPAWIIEQDEESGEDLAKLTQIVGSYLDTLYAQIGGVLNVKDLTYPTGSVKESPNNDRLLSSLGFEAPDLFDSVGEIVRFLDKDDKRPLESSIHEIKNVIYRNLYNNLSYILKSKGTKKSFGNTLRCMGIDEKIVKISTYADNIEQILTSSYKAVPTEKKFIDFSGLRRYDDQAATVYQFYYADGYDGGSSGLIASNANLGDNAFTLQADMIFPLKPSPTDELYIQPTSPSSSLFGFHTPNATGATSTNLTWASNTVDFGLQVYAVHAVGDYAEIVSPVAASRDAYFVVLDRLGNILLKTDTIKEVYNNTRWTMALSVRSKAYPFAEQVTGTNNEDQTYIVELYGASYDLEEQRSTFGVSTTLNFVTGSNTLTTAKRIYAGAHRENFNGSLLTRSDIRLNSCRFWNTFITSSDVNQQAKDADTYGLVHPYRNVRTFQTSGSSVYVPALESLALNWDFETVTGSDANGQFRVDDFSSGSNSTNYENNYQSNYAATVQRHHSARGDFFKTNDKPARKEYFPSLRLQAPEEISSDDMVSVIVEGSDDDVYGRSPRPVRYFFAVEKSMYDAVSNDMLEMFGSIDEFHNLIGEPVNKYRAQYKDLTKLREIFFRRVAGKQVDLDKYLDYYKWFDGALTNLVEQLFPASAPVAENTRNVVESHVLERNKYQHKYGVIKNYNPEPSGSVKGGFEQQYNWRFNHHPVTSTRTAATATIVIGDAGGIQHGETIVLTDFEGTATTYTINGGVAPASGGGSGGSATIGYSGVGGGVAGKVRAANALVLAFNQTTDANYTAVSDGVDTVTVTQDTAGTAGNRSITSGLGSTTVTGFAGAQDHVLSENQGENCGWWANRAERNASPLNLGPSAAVGAQVSLDRQNIFASVRKKRLENQRNRFYKFDGVVEKSLAGGHNQSFNKVKANVLTFDSVEDQTTCTDAVVPPGSPAEKIKKKFRVQIDGQNYKGDQMAPFSLYKALVASEHNKQLTNTGLSGTYMANVHEDSYYGSGFEVPMQGPFTRQHVGGLLSRTRSEQIQVSGNLRHENYKLTISSGTGSLTRLDTQSGATSSGKGHYYRGLMAKRPVNIANIAHQTGSHQASGFIVGNFDRNYQVVQTSGRRINNLDFRDDPNAYNPDAFLSPYVGGLVETPVPSRRDTEYTLKSRTTNKTIFVNRFSSPGSVETNTPAFLDFNALELAPNNALPFRNQLIRDVQRDRLTVYQFRGGLFGDYASQLLSSGYSVQDLNTGSFSSVPVSRHDTHRNDRPKPIIIRSAFGGSIIEGVQTGSVKNNAFVTTPIPSGDSTAWFLAYSGSDTQTYNQYFHSGGQIPQSITVPSPPDVGPETSIVGSTSESVTAQAEIVEFYVEPVGALGFDRFLISGSAWVIYDHTASSHFFVTNLSGSTGPTGLEAGYGTYDYIRNVDLSAAGSSQAVHTALSSAIHAAGIGQVSLDGGANPTASIAGISIAASTNPSSMTVTFTQQAYVDADVLAGLFMTVEDDASNYGGGKGPQIGNQVTQQGITGGTTVTLFQGFGVIEDYRTNSTTDATSPIFTASNGAVQYRWGAGNNYNSWQQVRQSQLRSREKTVGSNEINVFETSRTANGNQSETQQTLVDPFLYDSGVPIKTILSVEDARSPENQEIKFRDITIKHSYTNNKQGFVNGDANVKHKYTAKGDKQIYDSLRDMRTVSYSRTLDPEETGVGRIKRHEIGHQIFPQAKHKFLTASMSRNNFLYTRWKDDDEEINKKVSGSGEHIVADKLNVVAEETMATRIEDNFYSLNRQTNRYQIGYVNSQGYTMEEEFQHHYDSFDGATPKRTGHGTSSIWPLDSYAFADSVASGSKSVLTRSVYTGTGSSYLASNNLGEVLSAIYNLGAGELMNFKCGAPVKTGSQGFQPGNWWTKRSCHYINTMIHGDYDSFASPTNYTQSVAGNAMGGPLFMPPWTAGRDRKAVDGENKGDLIGSRGPFYNTYSDYYAGMKQVGRGMALIPEFRISEHIELYEDTNSGDYLAKNTGSYTLTGSSLLSLTSSANDGFMRRFQSTDFIKYMRQFMVDDQDINGLPTDLKLEAAAVQRILPYDGFYPVIRTLQVATLFSQSYSSKMIAHNVDQASEGPVVVTSSAWQNVLDYFYAPGIMYNSIKSGIAVDHPVFTRPLKRLNTIQGEPGFFLSGTNDAKTLHDISFGSKVKPAGMKQSDHMVGVLTDGGIRKEIAQFFTHRPLPRRLGHAEEVQPTGSEEVLAHMLYYPDRIPFETIVNPTEYLLSNEIQNNQAYDWFKNEATASFTAMASTKYTKGAGNFFGAVPDVFLENSRLTTIATDPNLVDPMAISVQSGTLYTMQISLRKTDNFNMYSNPIAFGPPTATGSAFNSGSEIMGANTGALGQVAHASPYETIGEIYKMFMTNNHGAPIGGVMNNVISLSNQVVGSLGHAGVGLALSGSTPSGSVWPLMHGDHAPHTPPYWYGQSWARIYFLPTASAQVTINEIIEQAEYEYGNDNDYLFDFRYNDTTTTDISAAFGTADIINAEAVTGITYVEGNGGEGIPAYMWNRAWQNKMEIRASITVDNRHPGNIQPRNSWVIMPKWECPILDFPHRETEHPLDGMAENRAGGLAGRRGRYNFSASFCQTPRTGDISLLIHSNSSGTGNPEDGGHYVVPQGMWHQYGVEPNAGEGVQMVVTELGPGEKEKRMKATKVRFTATGSHGALPKIITGAEVQLLPKIPNRLVDITATGDRKRKVKSLAKLVGFPSEVVNKPTNLGKIASKKALHEAIVAVPYYEDKNADIQFIPIPLKDESNQVVERFGKQVAKLRKVVSKYVLPPAIEEHMSYLVPESYPASSDGENLLLKPESAVFNNNKPPLALYMFEFTTELNKQDLADWWQGIMPEGSTKFSNTSVDVYTIDHATPGVGLQDFGAKPGPGGGKIDNRLRDLIDISRSVRGGTKDDPGFRPDIKWMVFKVKQRAPSSYEEIVRRSLVEAGAEIPGPKGQEAYSKRERGYNWPYDYFSMIELAKIDATVTFRPDIDEIESDKVETTKPVRSLDGPKPELPAPPKPKKPRRKRKNTKAPVKTPVPTKKEVNERQAKVQAKKDKKTKPKPKASPRDKNKLPDFKGKIGK